MSTLDSKTVTSGDEAGISRELLLKMWENMNLARNFEEHVQWLFSKGLVHGTTHLGIGEEATAAGTIAALKPQDYVFGTHRGHSQAICKGISVNNMMAEILAREAGVCKGKGGSMHIADPDIHYFGADGILGASAVMCNGTALAIKKRGEKDRISLVFFGDGTSNEGATWEAMNLAAVWQLPTLFVCVNNTYGMSTPIAQAMKDTDISKRAYPFDMPARSIDGNNVLEVYQTIKESRVRGFRQGPHAGGGEHLSYLRPLQERRQPVPHQGGDRVLEAEVPHQGLPQVSGGKRHRLRAGTGQYRAGGCRRHRRGGGICPGKS